jgi:hypothetical protein
MQVYIHYLNNKKPETISKYNRNQTMRARARLNRIRNPTLECELLLHPHSAVHTFIQHGRERIVIGTVGTEHV